MASTCKLTGLLPIAQPPGSATMAFENFDNKGPKTRIDALMVFTSSYLALRLFIVEASTSTSPVSERVISKPIEPNNSIIVVTSLRCGKFPTLRGLSANNEAARIGRAEFLAPEA